MNDMGTKTETAAESQNMINNCGHVYERRMRMNTWRSGAELGCARSQADNHGLLLPRAPVVSSPNLLSKLPPWLWLLCWLVPRRAPEINASAITTSPGPGRILTSGSAALAWCRPAWDALATPDDLGARAHGPIITVFCTAVLRFSVATQYIFLDVFELISLHYNYCRKTPRPSWAHTHFF